MDGVIRYTSTMLRDFNKSGKFKPDKDGYYTVPVGAFEQTASDGIYYTLKGAEDIFNNSAYFRTRIANGTLYGEQGHPIRKKNQTDTEFMDRVACIFEKHIACHHAEIWLDSTIAKSASNGFPAGAVVTMTKVKGAGPHMDATNASLANPKENTSFSIRSWAREIRTLANITRIPTDIFTWDPVYMGCVKAASKFNSPAMLSHDIVVDIDELEHMLEKRDSSVVEKVTMLSERGAIDNALANVRAFRNEKVKPNYLIF